MKILRVFASEDQAKLCVFGFFPYGLAWNVNIVLPLCLCVNSKGPLPLQGNLCVVTVAQFLSSVMIIFRLAKISRVTQYSKKVLQSGACLAEAGEGTPCQDRCSPMPHTRSFSLRERSP